MRRRLGKLGVRHAELSTAGGAMIVARVPRRISSSSAVGLLTRPGRLEFFDFEAHLGRTRGPGTEVVTCSMATGTCLGAQTQYVLRLPPELTGADVTLARADVDPQTNAPLIVMQFTARGKRVFAQITRREARRGRARCRGSSNVAQCAQHFAIVLDGKIVTAPYIDFVRNPDGIPGDNGAQIDYGGVGTFAEAKRVAIEIESGALPVRFVRMG
jgi:preprotein translocase subunit SecD